jgi:DNA-binding NarL/FixJ family response regulator
MTNLEIAEASDGARGMKLVMEREPRAVLMDINLPDANGIELAARIKAARPNTQVIMITNLTGSVYVERSFAAGASGYVYKEKIFTELLPVLMSALHGTQEHRA